MKNKTKIALFFGGKVTKHLGMIKRAARKLGVDLDLISYNRVYFDTEKGRVGIRRVEIGDYDILFFRTTGKHWEEVNLIVDSAKQNIKRGRTMVVDPLVLKGRPSDACKAYQMLALKKVGIPVPKTIYGSLWWLYEHMKSSQTAFCGASAKGGLPPPLRGSQCQEKLLTSKTDWKFPVILKGSGGDRGTRVYKAENLEGLERLVRELRKTETEEGRRYMLQEYIENQGDYRVLVLGKKVLGVMKRTRQKKGEFRNNFSLGGKVEVVDLPEEVKEAAVKAAEVCGLGVAGVDIIYNSKLVEKYCVLEVNKGPQFKGFMQATGIDVPQEIVKFLVSLSIKN